MDKKKLLIELYTVKDRSRRRLLMDLFADKITMNISIGYICLLINNELGQNGMITKRDIVYCRFHYTSKKEIKPKVFTIPKPSDLPKSKTEKSELTWSNPDDDDFKNQISIKSKHSKR